MTLDQLRLQKIARMLAVGHTQADCAKATGLTEGRISQIVASEEFATVQQDVLSKEFNTEQTLNDTWNEIESLAVETVLNYMKFSRDPEFALKTAVLSNRARRRVSAGNRPLVAEAGARRVIQLNVAFVNRLAEPRHLQGQDGVRKQKNVLQAGSVEKLLMLPAELPAEAEEAEENEFADVFA